MNASYRDRLNPANWSIVMPAYNEEEVIADVVADLCQRYPEAEILVVDDGSPDKTAERAEAAGARVVRHPRNRGNGAAVKTGARHATRELLIFMDADGQHKPEDIPRLVAPLAQDSPYEMAVGARTKASTTKIHRDLANWTYNRFSSYLANYRIEDLTSGFRALPRRLMRRYLSLLPNTFSYPSTITIAIIRSGFGVAYVPIVAKARVGQSKIRIFRDGIRFLIIMTRVATLFAPMRVFVPVSLFMATTGFSYMALYAILKGNTPGFAHTLVISSVLVFMMGLVAETIAQLRMDRIEDDLQARTDKLVEMELKQESVESE